MEAKVQRAMEVRTRVSAAQEVSTVDRSSATNKAHAMEAALLNPIVLRQIFAHLPVRLLLKSCSLVNQYWQNEARTYIRDQRSCNAFVGRKPGRTACLELKKLGNDFGNMRVNPFNGLYVTTACIECLGFAGEHWDVELLYHNILAAPFKYLRLWDIRFGSKFCPTFPVITKILQTQGSSLVEIQLDALSSNIFSGQTRDQILFFPRLKKLTVGWPEYGDPPKYDILHELVKAAPNLQELWGDKIDVSTLKNIPEDKYCAVRELILGNIKTVLDAEFLILFAQKCPTLHTCNMANPPVQAEIFERYRVAALRIWESSRHSLEVFKIKEPWSSDHPLEELRIPFRFQKIKIVRITETYNYDAFSFPSNFMKNLFNSMDTIEKILPGLSNALAATVPSRFYNLVQTLHLEIKKSMDEKDVWKFSNSSALTLRVLNVSLSDEMQFSSNLARVLECLLQHCFHTLEKLTFKFECEVLCLDKMSFPPLTNLKTLDINSCNLSESIQCMKRMDVQSFFPKLRDVTFQNIRNCKFHRINHDENEELITKEQNNDNSNKDSYYWDPKAAVDLNLWLRGEKVHLQDIAMIFPAVTALYFNWDRKSPIPYQQVWTLWPDLKQLHHNLPRQGGPCDNAFCGLHQEEIDELQNYSKEFLQALQIVSTGPSITNLRKLESLQLAFDMPEVSPSPIGKVMKELAIKRSPAWFK